MNKDKPHIFQSQEIIKATEAEIQKQHILNLKALNAELSALLKPKS